MTAPGGGDDQPKDGIEAAKIGGGYTKKSGTSMAAPLVSGALGLVLEHMPNLSPRQAAARLIEIASYEGLTTRSGCTITTCTEAKMQEVFGQGMINLEQALQPIGASSIINHAGQNNQITKTYITTPVLVGDAIKEGLEGSTAVVQDGFDGTQFLVSLDDCVISNHHPDQASWRQKKPASYGLSLGQSGFLTSISPTVPLADDAPAHLIDIPASGVQAWHGYGVENNRYSARAYLGYGENRQAVHLMMTSWLASTQSPSWFGLGFDRSTHWLDGHGDGALGYDTTGSRWIFAGHHHQFGAITATAEALIGQTELTPNQTGLLRGGELLYDSWSLRFDLPVKSQTIHWGWSAYIDQPPALRKGYMTIEQPIGFADGKYQFADQRVDLSLTARQKQGGLGLYAKPNATSLLQTGIDFIDNYRHRKGQDENRAFVRFTQKF